MISKDVIVPPYTFELEGAKVTILEVVRLTIGRDWRRYLVVLTIEYGGKRSRPFTLQVRNNAELLEKIKSEIAKMKILIWSGHAYLFT